MMETHSTHTSTVFNIPLKDDFEVTLLLQMHKAEDAGFTPLFPHRQASQLSSLEAMYPNEKDVEGPFMLVPSRR